MYQVSVDFVPVEISDKYSTVINFLKDYSTSNNNQLVYIGTTYPDGETYALLDEKGNVAHRATIETV